MKTGERDTLAYWNRRDAMTKQTEQPDTANRAIRPVLEKISALDAETPFATVIDALGIIAECKRMLTDLQRQAEAVAVEQLQRTGPIILGDVKWYASYPRSHKVRDLQAAAQEVMEASGGDWQRFCDCLSSSAFKPGECRKLFDECNDPERFGRVFETTYKAMLADGKPTKKELQSVPLRFLERSDPTQIQTDSTQTTTTLTHES